MQRPQHSSSTRLQPLHFFSIMTKPKFIGLTGRAGCGKDSVRSILELDYHAQGLALADPIRDMLLTLMETSGVSIQYGTRRELKESISELGYSYRQLAQTLGTEWGRLALSPDFWTGIADLRIQGFCVDTFNPTTFVVSDIRYNTEAKWLRAKGGLIWEIRRPDAQKVRAHSSEHGIDQSLVDQIILNDGTLSDLPDLVRSA